MQTFLEKLVSALKKDSRFVDQEGELLKSEVIDKAYKIDKNLVGLLLEDEEIAKKFFTEIKKHWIFEVNDFVAYIQDKNFLNDSYTNYKNKIGLNIGGKFLNERKEVSLVWPFKDCVLEAGMTKEDEKRKEIFFNEILAHDEIDKLFSPKVLINWKRFAKNGEEKVADLKRDEKGIIRENFIIKGNNLLALHTIKKQFQGKVKLIYIDPPYNTGNDSFGYNDNFNHSSWLTFMKNRLEIVRELLNENGSIWINIDDNESHYLKVLCDDIFGRENFVANVIWEKKYSPQNDSKWLSDSHDHILVFAKNKLTWRPNLLPRTEEMNARYKNPDNDSRGLWKSGDVLVKSFSESGVFPIINPNTGKEFWPPKGSCYRFSKESSVKYLEDNRFYFGKDGKGGPQLKRFLFEVKEGSVSKTIWNRIEVGDNQEANQEIDKLGFNNIFSTPKSERLLKRIIELGSKENDIVLDFFSGSGTTLAVAHKMNRQYIGIEQMDYIHDLPEARLIKVIAGEQGGISKAVNWKGGGSFVYCELAKYNEAFIDEIDKAEDTVGLLKIWEKMKEKSFLNWNVDLKAVNESLEEFKTFSIGKQKEILLEMLNKNQLYVNLSEIKDVTYKISEDDKKVNGEFYGK